MSKRSYEDDDTSRPPKRSKAERPDHLYQPPTVQQIDYARQLQDLLVFRQDGIQELRNGIASFKALLESILYHRDEDIRPRQLSILREYLDSQKPPPNLPDTEQPFLHQLWQAWSFANQNNNDHLASAISAIIALLLRTLSGLLDYKEYGVLLCRTVLQRQHLRLVKRGLDAPPRKEYVISPCLRLLTEVAGFDGGALAKELYKRREQTFDVSSLRRNLGLVKTETSDEESRRRPSIRTLTVRYILALFKFLHEGAKADILRSKPLCGSLFHFLRDDPSEMVLEMLTIIERHVLRDDELQRSAKASLLQSYTLERVTDIATRSGDNHAAAVKAYAWLKAICTTPSYGVLRAGAWYPPGSTKSDLYHGHDQDFVDLGLDGLDFYDQGHRPDVRNPTLLTWIQTLRPHADLKERELTIACFKSAPELVAAYFAEKTMQLEPKLTNTWIGYASFMFDVIRLPIPRYFGNIEEEGVASLPPQSNIMMESILPRPLSQKVLARCLNQLSGVDGSPLISFFAVRILVVAFQKVSTIRAQIETYSGELKHLWREACERLVARLADRIPAMKDVVNIFRQISDHDDHALQRESITRLLRLYFEVTPMQALEEKLDISAALAIALGRDFDNDVEPELHGLRTLELENLLLVAKLSPGMRWFNKQGSLSYSPIVTLLKLHAHDHNNRNVRMLIEQVLTEHSIVSDTASLNALIASLVDVSDAHAELWPAIDDYFARLSRQPVKYLDQVEALVPSEENQQATTLLLGVLVEQAPYAIEKSAVIDWIGRFVYLLACAHHEQTLMKTIYKAIDGLPAWTVTKSRYDAEEMVSRVQLAEAKPVDHIEAMDPKVETNQTPFEEPATETEHHPEILRWTRKDLDIAIEDGDLDALIFCLSSKHVDIRGQALAQLRILKTRLLQSNLEDKTQLSVLIGEVIETYEEHFLPNHMRAPFLISAFAARCLHVLVQPTHHMYPKVNRFLIKSPEWRVSRMPSYWLANTALTYPEEDDAYWKEVQWVLEWLMQSTRTVEDVEVLRKGGIYVKVMALYHSPKASPDLVKRRILELLWRTTAVETGSNMLITRAGVIAWCDMVRTQDKQGGLATALKTRVLRTCDKEKVSKWCGAQIETL
nr:nucleolar pre-ribosomal-associated protein 1 [Quercus suber]